MPLEPSTTPDEPWQTALDPRLAGRLARPLWQGGVIDHGLARAILGRAQQMAHGVPLLADLERRRGAAEAEQTGPPIVYAMARVSDSATTAAPAAHMPTVQRPSMRATALQSDRPAASGDDPAQATATPGHADNPAQSMAAPSSRAIVQPKLDQTAPRRTAAPSEHASSAPHTGSAPVGRSPDPLASTTQTGQPGHGSTSVVQRSVDPPPPLGAALPVVRARTDLAAPDAAGRHAASAHGGERTPSAGAMQPPASARHPAGPNATPLPVRQSTPRQAVAPSSERAGRPAISRTPAPPRSGALPLVRERAQPERAPSAAPLPIVVSRTVAEGGERARRGQEAGALIQRSSMVEPRVVQRVTDLQVGESPLGDPLGGTQPRGEADAGELVDQVLRALDRRIVVEGERRGVQRWR